MLTHHARRRARERTGLPQAQASALVARTAREGVTLSPRVVNQLGLLRKSHRWGWQGGPKGSSRYKVGATLLVVLKGKAVVTTWTLTVEDLAAVLCWAMGLRGGG